MRVFKALCERDCVQDVPYQYFKQGEEYYIRDDCPVKRWFKELGELSAKEADQVLEEKIPQPRKPGRPKVIRKMDTVSGPGLAEVEE